MSQKSEALARAQTPWMRSEFMLCCLFVGPLFQVPPATVYVCRWPRGRDSVAQAHLAAFGLLMGLHGRDVVHLLIPDPGTAEALIRAVQRKRRKGFSLRQFKAWRPKP